MTGTAQQQQDIPMASVPVTAHRGASMPAGHRRTNPLSFAVNGVSQLARMAVPLAIGAVTIFDKGEMGKLLLVAPIVFAVLGVNFFIAWLRWLRLTYIAGADDIRVESGIVSRAARSVPYERIQDVSLEQKLIPRLFGLVELRFETGAGGKDELKLAYLSRDEGEALRRLVRARRSGETVADAGGKATDATVADDEADEQAQLLFAMDRQRLTTFGFFEFSLAVFAVLGGAAQYAETFMGFEAWDPDLWQQVFALQEQWILGLGPMAQVFAVIAALVVLLFTGSATGMVRTFLRDWGFRLERTSRGFRRRRGLLTRTDVVMPLHRVQAVNISTGFVRNWFGWKSLSFVSLAQDSGSSSHVVAPFARDDELAPIIRIAGFTPPAEGLDWHPASRSHRNVAMIVNGCVLSLVGFAVLTIMAIGPVENIDHGGWLVLVPFAAGAFLVAREFYIWRFARNAVSATQVFRRTGWLAPSVQIAQRVKLQSVEIVQGPIARRRGYATLHLGLAGGTFTIRGIALERARELRQAVLASIAERDFSALT